MGKRLLYALPFKSLPFFMRHSNLRIYFSDDIINLLNLKILKEI